MERGKRASMREGPLAALFRKTDEEGAPEGADSAGNPRREVETARAQEARSAERAEFGQVPEAQEPPEPRVGKPHPSADRLEDRDPRLEELRPAPPSARTRHEEPAPIERRVRTPEERLREVFSTDIPENIMELSPAKPEPDKPRFGREEPAM